MCIAYYNIHKRAITLYPRCQIAQLRVFFLGCGIHDGPDMEQALATCDTQGISTVNTLTKQYHCGKLRTYWDLATAAFTCIKRGLDLVDLRASIQEAGVAQERA